MNIIMLCAGTSSRMGKANKLLLPYGGYSLVAYCAKQAASFLQSLGESSRFIAVTGYEHEKIERELLSGLKDFSNSTDIIIEENRYFERGQFSSLKKGVEQLSNKDRTFICLADMPLLSIEHFRQLAEIRTSAAVVRPVDGTTPGHPVLIDFVTAEKIKAVPYTSNARNVLANCDVLSFETNDPAFFTDADTPESYNNLIMHLQCGLQAQP